MRKRMIITLAALAAFVAGIGLVKFLQIKAAMAQGASWQPPPEAVTTIVAHVEHWSSSLSAIGSVAAVHGVTVSADLPGIVESIDFESGHGVNAGDVLVRLDTSQERAQLAAAEAKQAEAGAGEIRAAIERKRIRAPFAGILGIRQVNLGQYLTAGDPVVPLQ